MQVITSIPEMQQYSEKMRLSGQRIGVVPTMGYLHDGHLSLIRLAKEHSDFVITTVFVNPTQFSPEEDFEAYPRDLNRDIALTESVGSDVVFAPSPPDVYNANYLTYVNVEKITSLLEGKYRLTHFRGVTTVVAKLFNITKPHVAVFGQKDAQQVIVIKKMVKDLNYDVEIIVAPTVRESNGLAMSSRNVYITNGEKDEAAVLFKSLKLAESLVKNGEVSVSHIKSKMTDLILSVPKMSIDYVSFTDESTLDKVETVADKPILISLAARFGNVRLVDNIVVNSERQNIKL
ncbi:MAG: pantoate--beta-alanine ligase [Bacteroidetes bacterium]|nr:pantoate--beta-alanine ligase [Bacteroidota bacterium]